MGSAVERLLGLVEAEGRHDIPHADLAPLQLEAANERLQEQIGRIRLLENRAATTGVSRIRDAADLVPLLFAHTAYKSYAENWLAEGRWDRMGKWLETVSAYPVEGVDTDAVQGIDDWLERLKPTGHHLSCSSGTTGKPAMLTSSAADREITKRMHVATLSWATGIKPAGDYRIFGMQPASNVAKINDVKEAFDESFGSPETTFQFPVAPITIGQIMDMIALRRRIADGTARPADVAGFQSLSAARQEGLDRAMGEVAEALVASRGEKLFVSGMWANMYKIAEAVRALGYSGKDFNPENASCVAGGLKGATLPPDYREYVYETFNLAEPRRYNIYSMQEINTPFPQCSAGRYHVPPWVMLLMLDESGEQLLEPNDGEIEGRAAFFDLSLDARWGGVISGDKIKAHYGTCACGHQGPTVGPEITRYSDLAGGDKISCSGTIDAYVRGEA